MGYITAFAAQKGGVGKTTFCAQMAACLRNRGLRVLCVDLDAQGNLTYCSGIEGFAYTVVDVLTKAVPTRAAIHEDFIASGQQLASADLMFTSIGKNFLMREALEGLKAEYDHIFIDCPPALNTLSVNALTCSDYVVIPAQADIFSVQGIMQLGASIDEVRKYANNPGLKVAGIALNRYNPRSIISQEIHSMISKVAADMGTSIFATTVRECSALKEAMALRTDIFAHAPKSNAAVDFSALTDEFLATIRR